MNRLTGLACLALILMMLPLSPLVVSSQVQPTTTLPTGLPSLHPYPIGEAPANYIYYNDSAQMVTDGTYIYVGTSYGAVIKVDPVAGKVVKSAELFNYSRVFSMAYYDGSLYVGTSIVGSYYYPFGIFRVDPSSLTVLSNYTTGANGVADMLGANGYIYLGTGGGWGDQLYPNLTLVRQAGLPVGMPYTSLADMAFDGQDIWWVNYALVFATDLNMSLLAKGVSPSGSEISSLAVIEGRPYATDDAGHVYRLSVDNGSVMFDLALTLPVVSQVTSEMQKVGDYLLVAPSGVRISPENGEGPLPVAGSVLVYSWPGLSLVSTFVVPDGLHLGGGESGLISVGGVPYTVTLNTLYRVPLTGNASNAKSFPLASDLELTSPSPAATENASAFSAVLRDSTGNPIKGGDVQFYVAGVWNGTATTDAGGVAVLNLTTAVPSGSQVQATFWGKGENPPGVSSVVFPQVQESNDTYQPPASSQDAPTKASLPTDITIPLTVAAVAVLSAVVFTATAPMRRSKAVG